MTPAPKNEEAERLLRCIRMAMGCLDPLSPRPDERLAWFRLLDGVEGREPRTTGHEMFRSS
jgi:hypothetical protein